MNQFRSHAAAAVVNGKIFCSGGFTKSVEYYDSSSDVWTRICNMPQDLNGHGAVEINGNFVIMGGFKFPNYLKEVWVLDTTEGKAKWIEKPSMTIPRRQFSIAKIYGKVFICGGRGAGDSVEIFDGEVWRNGSKMPTSRLYFPAVVIPMEFAKNLN